MYKVVIVFILAIVSLAAKGQAPAAANLEAGKKLFAKYCLPCHMADGGGVPGLNPPLAKTDWVTGDKKRLINVLLKGLNEPIEVNGDEYANPMPAVDYLTDQEIADVLTYIRNSFGNKATAVTAAEVTAQRATIQKAKK